MHPLSSRFIDYPSHVWDRGAARHVRFEVMDNAQLPQIIRDSPGDGKRAADRRRAPQVTARAGL
jgi:hypothetical protein